MIKLRIALARILLPILTVWLCVMPARSYAVLPAAIPLLVAIAESGVVRASLSAGVTAFWGSISALAGYNLYIQISDATGNFTRLPLGWGSSSIPVPAAPATSTPTSAQGVGPISMVGYWQTSGLVLTGSDPGALALQYMQTAFPQWSYPGTYTASCPASPADQTHCSVTVDRLIDGVSNPASVDLVFIASTTCPVNSTQVGSSSCECNAGFISDVSGSCVAATMSCAAGYSASGSSCVLTDPRAVTSDGALDFERDAVLNAFVPSSSADADQESSPVHGSLNPDGSFEIAGVDSAGNPMIVRVRPLAGGGTELSVFTQSADSAGNSVVTNNVFNFAADGSPISQSQTQIPGYIIVDPVTQTGTVVPAVPGTVTNPTAPISIDFPNDYARQGEIASAIAPVVPALDTIHRDLSDTTAVADPTDPGALPDDWGSTFSNLLSWQLPSHSSQCPTPNFDLSGLGMGMHTMDAHCGLLVDHAAGLHAAMVVVFTMMALFTVLRA